MIQVFYEIGKQTSRPVPYEPVSENSYLFVLDVGKMCVYSEELDGVKAKRYVWVGNRKGSQVKDRLIVSGGALRYLIFSTVFILEKELKKIGNPSMEGLAMRLENLSGKLGVLKLRNKQGKPFAMLKVYRLIPSKEKEFLEALKKVVVKEMGQGIPIGENLEETLRSWSSLYSKNENFERAVTQAFQEAVTEGIPSKATILWTFKDEKGILTEDPAYFDYIAYTFRPPIDDAAEGVCRICNKKGRVTPKTTAFKFFKFWNTDKPGFAPRLDGNLFSSVFGLCPSCYTFVLEGDRFVSDRLRTKFANLNVVLIPHPVPEKGDLLELSELLKKRLSAVDTVEAWREFQDTLQEQSELWERVKDSVYLDLVFFEASQSKVKVSKVIHEVPPSRLDELDDVRRESLEWARTYFKGSSRGKSPWDLDLRTQFSLVPTRKDTKVPSLFLNYLEALLTKEIFPKGALIKGFLEIARAHHLGYTKSFKGVPSRSVEQFMVQTLVMQYYGEKLGIFHPTRRGGIQMVLEHLPEHLRSYVESYVPKGKPQGLFLIGYVIGLIAKAQQEGISGKDRKSSPILNAISFTGMDDSKVRRLINHVADRMRHYLKGWNYNEGEKVLSVAIQVFENDKNTLPNYENTYWVLAGYGFSRLGLYKKEEE